MPGDTCRSCGKSFWISQLNSKGNCKVCEAEARASWEASREAELESIVLSSETGGFAIEERLGIVAGETLVAIFPATSNRTLADLERGQIETTKLFREKRETVLRMLRVEAHRLGADAIVALHIEVSSFGCGAIIYAFGTAVRLMKVTADPYAIQRQQRP